MSSIAGAGTMKNLAGGASLLGGILGAGGASSEAKQQSAQLRQQAGQLRTQANNVNASTQLEARAETDKARQAESTSLANAAASGANANSVSAINNRADIAQQGELNNLITLWNGEQQANQLKIRLTPWMRRPNRLKKPAFWARLLPFLALEHLSIKFTDKKYASFTIC